MCYIKSIAAFESWRGFIFSPKKRIETWQVVTHKKKKKMLSSNSQDIFLERYCWSFSSIRKKETVVGFFGGGFFFLFGCVFCLFVFLMGPEIFLCIWNKLI